MGSLADDAARIRRDRQTAQTESAAERERLADDFIEWARAQDLKPVPFYRTTTVEVDLSDGGTFEQQTLPEVLAVGWPVSFGGVRGVALVLTPRRFVYFDYMRPNKSTSDPMRAGYVHGSRSLIDIDARLEHWWLRNEFVQFMSNYGED